MLLPRDLDSHKMSVIFSLDRFDDKKEFGYDVVSKVIIIEVTALVLFGYKFESFFTIE